MKKKYNTARVSNDLIESFIKQNNHIPFKILFYLSRYDISIPKDKELVEIIIDRNDLIEYCGIDKQTLYRYVKKLVNTSISIVKNNKITYISVIPKASFILGTNKLEITMFKEVMELISEVKRRFTTINIINLMKLKSKHSIKMIQILEMINGFDEKVGKRKTYTLEQLNNLFGTNYKRLKTFENEVLKKVQKELDDKSILSFIYQVNYKKNPKGIGRPYANSITIDLIKK